MNDEERIPMEFDETLVEQPEPVNTQSLSEPPLHSIREASDPPSTSADTGALAASPASSTPSVPAATAAEESAGSAAPSTAAGGSPLDIDTERYFSLVLRDGLDMPIAGLDVFVTLPDGQMCQATTGPHGALTVPLAAEAKGEAKVEVKDATGAKQEVCRLDVEQCKQAVIVRSPKVKAKLTLRPHQQTPPPSAPRPTGRPPTSPAVTASGRAPAKAAAPPATPSKTSWWSDAVHTAWSWISGSAHVPAQPPAAPPATVQETLTPAGQPVTIAVGPECPNKDNLRLGKNNVYRQAILLGASRLGLIPQALCALMDCEAAKIREMVPVVGPDGKPVINKKTKKPLMHDIGDVWNPNSKASANDETKAAGLTQFLASTWLDHVMREGFYIHDQSVAKGWVKQEQVLKKGKPAGTRWVFALSDGKTTSTPWKHTGDANVQQCMKMRYDPTWSIIAAADYGKSNLDALRKQGFKVDQLPPMDKAKLMYLLHHEGLGNGCHFINNTFANASSLRNIFNQQVGAAIASKWIENFDDEVADAYRNWLAKYIDEKFAQAIKYFCCNPAAPSPLSSVLTSIGGKKI